MFKVGIGPEGEAAYLRPETCQSIFVDFPRLFKTMRGKLPLGIAQVGKSFRNEISPRQSLLRLREFYQAEIEVFCNPNKLNDMEKLPHLIKDIVPTKPESFEVTQYSDDGADQVVEKFSHIKQIVEGWCHDNSAFPTGAIRVSLSGNTMKLIIHSYEMHLPVRMKEVQENSSKLLNEALKKLKKEFKTRSKSTLDLKELKDQANYTVQKVSLNERYYFVSWRCFELG